MNLADNRLGAVLSRMGLVAKADVEKALTIGFDRRLPIGKVLVLEEKISNKLLRLGLNAQWMIKDQLLGEHDATQAVQLANRNGWTFQDALMTIGIEANPTKGTRLGEILIDAGILTEQSVKDALRLTTATDLPLGRVLIARGIVGEGIISHAINLQRSLREDVISADQVVSLLKGVCDDLACVNFRTGELLVAARLIDKAQVNEALESAIKNKKPIGEVLIELDHIHRGHLNKVIEIQGLLRQNRLGYFDALNLLRRVGPELTYSVEAEASQDKDKHRALSLYEFLKLIDYFSERKLDVLVLKLAEDRGLVQDIIRNAGTDPARLTTKESLKTIMENSEMLAQVLVHYYPDDNERIKFSREKTSAINNRRQTAESALLDYVARFHLVA